MDEAALRERAEKRVATRAALWRHVFTYLFVNAFLFAIDWWPDGGIDWAYWGALGWGLGVALHVVTSLFGPSSDRSVAVEREMERLRRRAT